MQGLAPSQIFQPFPFFYPLSSAPLLNCQWQDILARSCLGPFFSAHVEVAVGPVVSKYEVDYAAKMGRGLLPPAFLFFFPFGHLEDFAYEVWASTETNIFFFGTDDTPRSDYEVSGSFFRGLTR